MEDIYLHTLSDWGKPKKAELCNGVVYTFSLVFLPPLLLQDFIVIFFQQIFIRHLLCARDSSRCS